jgi:hypothetical protein
MFYLLVFCLCIKVLVLKKSRKYYFIIIFFYFFMNDININIKLSICNSKCDSERKNSDNIGVNTGSEKSLNENSQLQGKNCTLEMVNGVMTPVCEAVPEKPGCQTELQFTNGMPMTVEVCEKIVDLTVLIRNSNYLTAQKHIIKNFPEKEYENFRNQIEAESKKGALNDSNLIHLINYLISSWKDNYQTSLAEKSESLELTDHYFLDINPDNSDKNARLKYKIFLPMSKDDFRKKSFGFMTSNKDAIEDWSEEMGFEDSSTKMHNLNRFLKYNNTILVGDLIVNDPSIRSIYSGCLMEKTEYGEFKTNTYEIYSDYEELQDWINIVSGDLKRLADDLEAQNFICIYGKPIEKTCFGGDIYNFEHNEDSSKVKLNKYFFASPNLNLDLFKKIFSSYKLQDFINKSAHDYFLKNLDVGPSKSINFMTSDEKSFELFIDGNDKGSEQYINQNDGQKKILELINDLVLINKFVFIFRENTKDFNKTLYLHFLEDGKLARETFVLREVGAKDTMIKIFKDAYPKDINSALLTFEENKINFIQKAKEYLETKEYTVWEPSKTEIFKMTKRTFLVPSHSSVLKNVFENGSFSAVTDLLSLFGISTSSGDFGELSFGFGPDGFAQTSKPEERFAFLFLDTNKNSASQTYVIDPCLDLNPEINLNQDTEVGQEALKLSKNTLENVLLVWHYHYRKFKNMSGYKFETFWSEFTAPDLNNLLNRPENVQKDLKNEPSARANFIAQIAMRSPKFYKYGSTTESEKYRIGFSDYARSTAPANIFDPIRNNIYSKWEWANPDYSCLYYGPDANENKGCYELRYSAELQMKGHSFCDT